MSELLVVGSVYKTRISCSMNEQIGINARRNSVVSIVGPATPSTDDLALAEDVRLAPLYKALMATAASYDGVSVNRVSGSLLVNLPGISFASQGPGTVAGDALPRQCAGMISLYANFIGKQFRGRSFIPFAAEADNGAAGLPTAGYITRLATLAVAYRQLWTFTPVVGTVVTMQPVIYKDFALLGPYSVDTAIARAKWATQRRRGSYGRPNN